MNKSNNQLNKPMGEEWEIKFDILAINLGMDGEQMDEIRDFIRQLLSQTKSQIVEQILGMESMKEETPLIKSEYPELGKLHFDTKQFDEAIIRNQLREEIKKEINNL